MKPTRTLKGATKPSLEEPGQSLNMQDFPLAIGPSHAAIFALP
jgi:hypothetical protein